MAALPADPAAEDLESIKDLYDRHARAVANRPELARRSGHAHVRLSGGLARVVATPGEPGGGELPSGLSPNGEAGLPRPEDLLRASLAASLALGYRQWGARLEVPLGGVEVEVRTKDDARGQLLIETQVPPGWLRIQIVVTIVTAADHADVQRVIECANRHCLVLATLSPQIERVHQLNLLPPPAANARGPAAP